MSFFSEKPEVVVALFDLLFNKENSANIVVKFTAIKLIGELGNWTDKNPNILGMAAESCFM